jgi:uncharacterized protein YdeI (YjbR/CyaY-like superfamily)
MSKSSELPTLPFASQSKWADWLAKQHDKSAGAWMKLAKKDSGIPSVTYAEALDVALCYGWIDGQKNTSCKNSRRADRRAFGQRSMWKKWSA